MSAILNAGKSALVLCLVAAAFLAVHQSAYGQAATKGPQPRKLRVVVFGAHCDDPESAAGGLIASLDPRRARGDLRLCDLLPRRSEVLRPARGRSPPRGSHGGLQDPRCNPQVLPLRPRKTHGRRSDGEGGFGVVRRDQARHCRDALAAGHASQSPRHRFDGVAVLQAFRRVEPLLLRGRRGHAIFGLLSRAVPRHRRRFWRRRNRHASATRVRSRRLRGGRCTSRCTATGAFSAECPTPRPTHWSRPSPAVRCCPCSSCRSGIDRRRQGFCV